MANKNLKKLQELSAKYNVPFQPLYTAKALENGNLQVVHNIMLRGQKITCLQQMTHEQLEKLFKGETAEKQAEKKQDNTVVFTKNNTISINGNRYNLLDVIKDMEISYVYEIIENYMTHGEEWQIEMAEKLRAYMLNGGFVEWLEYQYKKEYGETVEEYAEKTGLNIIECMGV